jgi:hypothetical protein
MGFLAELKDRKITESDTVVLTAGNSSLCKMFLRLKQLQQVPGQVVCVVRNLACAPELKGLGASQVTRL